jgi:hypothetical protein
MQPTDDLCLICEEQRGEASGTRASRLWGNGSNLKIKTPYSNTKYNIQSQSQYCRQLTVL